MLIYCEKKVLLTSCWLITGANLVREKNTADRLADKPAERSENQVREDFSIKKIGKVVFSW